jgi:hypothetical protein
MPHRIFLLLFFAIVALYSTSLYAIQIELNVADITSPAFAAQGLSVTLLQDGAADLRIAALQLGEKKWKKLHLYCAKFILGADKLKCERGKLDIAPALPFTLVYEFSSKKVEFNLLGDNGESLQLHADFMVQPWQLSATFLKTQIKRFAPLLPVSTPMPTGGNLSGSLSVQGGKLGVGRINADVHLRDGAFSDESGLHAGEKIELNLNVEASHTEQEWLAKVGLAWLDGEIFWQPLYLHGGHQLQAELQWNGKQLKLPQATLSAVGIGDIKFSGMWDAESKKLTEAAVSGASLGLARLFADYAIPYIGGETAKASLMSGVADFDLKYINGAVKEFRLVMHDAAYEDGKKRFSLHGLNADIPWLSEQNTQAQLSFDAGAIWGVPLGATGLQMSMNGLDFSVPAASLQILDGKLSIQDFHLQQQGDEWNWEFSGVLTPVSMPALSVTLGWPEMQGSLSGMIPHVSYQHKELNVDGALLFRVFDGRVVASSLKLLDPFGPAPKLYGNLDMSELDLGALTHAFSFGNVQGRIDVNVNGLELVNWLPVRFDASVASSPGNYRKKISQKAVQNISSLGGAGAAAAVQRSVMSVFENFGYNRIVLSCRLRNGVCAMDGEDAKDNSYYIVKGGGIPAINVMGYNHSVDWDELLNRLKRVIKGNRKAVVE